MQIFFAIFWLFQAVCSNFVISVFVLFQPRARNSRNIFLAFFGRFLRFFEPKITYGRE